jgi:hypothetical protein
MAIPQPTGDGEIVGLGTPSANIRHYPVGTLEELLRDVCKGDEERFAQAKMEFATCSMPDKDNRGCPFFKKCEFKKWRGKIGPRRIGVLSAIWRGLASIKVMPCYVYMSVMHAIRMLSKSQAVRVVAQEGDIVKVKETIRVNPKDVKDFRHKLVWRNRLIKPFPRPLETLADVAFSMQVLQEADMDRIQQRDREIFGSTFVGDMSKLVEDGGLVMGENVPELSGIVEPEPAEATEEPGLQ